MRLFVVRVHALAKNFRLIEASLKLSPCRTMRFGGLAKAMEKLDFSTDDACASSLGLPHLMSWISKRCLQNRGQVEAEKVRGLLEQVTDKPAHGEG